MRRSIYLTVLALFLVLRSLAWAAETIPKKLTMREGATLVNKALGMERGSLDWDDKYDAPQFYFYQGLGPVAGSYGFFSVNVWTGRVWSEWECKWLSTPALRRSQAKIRRRFTPEEMKQYQRLNDLTPECMYGLGDEGESGK
jgi:hypothetical protein